MHQTPAITPPSPLTLQDASESLPTIQLLIENDKGGWIRSDEDIEESALLLTWRTRNFDIFYEQPTQPCAVRQGDDFVISLAVVIDRENVVEVIPMPRSIGADLDGNTSLSMEPGQTC
jgi:hypothetical protein